MKRTCASLIIVGMCGLVLSAGCLGFWGASKADDHLRATTAKVDRVTLLGLEQKAREASLSALDAEEQGEYEKSKELYSNAYAYYRSLASGAYYKTCCISFAQTKYSEALDKLLDFMKVDPDAAQFIWSKGGGFASQVYVCLYYECGKYEADGWLKDTFEHLDEQGRTWMTILTDRALKDSDIATARNGLSKWQRDQIIMYRKRLSEIDATKHEQNVGNHKTRTKFKTS